MTAFKSHLVQGPTFPRFALPLAPKDVSNTRFATRAAAFPALRERSPCVPLARTLRKTLRLYIASQVEKECFDDPRFRAMLAQFTCAFPAVDLAMPSESRGAVLVQFAHRPGCRGPRPVSRSCAASCPLRPRFADREKKAHKIASISVMPDHLHLALRGNIDSSPLDIALGFQNNLAYAMGQVPIWQEGFYAGTFSEYDMGAIRRSTAQADQPDSPSGKPDGVWL